jgi:hypothetical protein
MHHDNEYWDVIVQRIADGGTIDSTISVTTPSREVLVSYVLSKLVEVGIHFKFTKAENETIWTLECVNNRKIDKRKTWVIFYPVSQDCRMTVSFYRERFFAERTNFPIGVACSACNRSIMM